MLWQIQGCGTGYSSISIADGKFYTMGDRPDGGGKSQFVIAFDLATHKELWATKIGPKHDDGSRCTPTLDGDRLYALGTSSDLVCLDSATGELKWKKNLEQDFGGEMMSGWRWSESPLVDGNQVVCTPGVKDAAMVALDKNTGDLIWKCAMPEIGEQWQGWCGLHDDRGGGDRWCPPVHDDHWPRRHWRGGRDRQVLVGLQPHRQRAWPTFPSPVVRDRYVFVTTSYKTGSALLKLTKNGDVFDAEEVYFLTPKQFENHHGGVVLVGDCIYGGDGQNNGTPVCLDFMTGKIKWKALDWKRKANADGSAAVLFADGNLWFRYEKEALVALIEATPDEFRVKGTFKAAVDDGPAWAHPVIHDGKLYLRANDTLMCYDVKSR